MPSIVTAALDLVPSCLHATYAQAAYKLSNDRTYMVHAERPKLSRPASATNKRHKGSSYYKIFITRPGAHSPSLAAVTEIKMKQVCWQLMQSQGSNHACM